MRWILLVATLWTGVARAETVPTVVADIPPVHALVAQVMAGVGEPVLLLDGSASPHGGSLRPSQARALANADLTIWMGGALTPWLARSVKGETLALLEDGGGETLPLREGGMLHEGHDHGHGHDDHGNSDEDAIIDPHAWLDPANGRAWLGAIADALTRIDPANAETYAANAAAGQAELDVVQARIKAMLAPVHDRHFAVTHDAFQYFENRFDLHIEAALTAGDGDRAGARRVRDVRTALIDEDIDCLLAEPGGSTPDRLVEGTTVRVLRLDQLGSTLPVGPTLYAAMLEGMATTIASCR